ncbi:MAG: alpha/beta fold hydrolase [Myxococcota bacterium]
MTSRDDSPSEREVELNGYPCRVLEKGAGELLGFLPGAPGLVHWTPFLDRLSARRRVIVPSLPGFLGANGHLELDDTLDWIAATLELLGAAGLDGADLVAASVSGMLAAEVAALSRASVRRLVLIDSYGLCDESEPPTDVFATPAAELPSLLSADPPKLAAYMAPPTDTAEAEEFQMLLYRAQEAAARLTWPMGDRGLAKRLHRITAPTLLIWGAEDRVVPASYAKRFADAIAGPTQVRSIAGAGHLAEIDAPDEVAAAIEAFLG